MCAPDALESPARERLDPDAILQRLRAIRDQATTGTEPLKALVEEGRR